MNEWTPRQGTNGRIHAILREQECEGRKWKCECPACHKHKESALILAVCAVIAVVLMLCFVSRADGGPRPICAPHGICKP